MSRLTVRTLVDRKPPSEPEPQAHVVQFYTNDSYLIECVSQFVCSALGSGEPVIVIAVEKHLQGLAQSFKEHGIDVTGAMKQGRCVLLNAAETLDKFMGASLPNERKFRAVIGSLIKKSESKAPGRQVAIFGEMVALLWERKKFEAALRLEQLWNELAKNYSYYLRCAYPTSGFQGRRKGQPYTAVCDEHSAVIAAEN